MQIWSCEAAIKKVETDSTFSLRFFSLTNHIAEIWFSIRANKFAEWRTGSKHATIAEII
jgi:hypothetical protein